MKVIITGGKDFNDYTLLKLKCNELLKNCSDIEIVSTGDDGASKLGELYAKDFGYPIKRFPIGSSFYTKAVEADRNKQLIEYSDILIAFWDEKGRETKAIIDIANSEYLPTTIIYY